jgi:dCTP deaminase
MRIDLALSRVPWVREGSRLNQVRFRSRNSKQKELADFAVKDHEIRERHARTPLVDGDLDLREGLILRVALSGSPGQIVGYRAQKNGDIIDVDRPGAPIPPTNSGSRSARGPTRG